jgi:hypothetical protein
MQEVKPVWVHVGVYTINLNAIAYLQENRDELCVVFASESKNGASPIKLSGDAADRFKQLFWQQMSPQS